MVAMEKILCYKENTLNRSSMERRPLTNLLFNNSSIERKPLTILPYAKNFSIFKLERVCSTMEIILLTEIYREKAYYSFCIGTRPFADLL